MNNSIPTISRLEKEAKPYSICDSSFCSSLIVQTDPTRPSPSRTTATIQTETMPDRRCRPKRVWLATTRVVVSVPPAKMLFRPKYPRPSSFAASVPRSLYGVPPIPRRSNFCRNEWPRSVTWRPSKRDWVGVQSSGIFVTATGRVSCSTPHGMMSSRECYPVLWRCGMKSRGFSAPRLHVTTRQYYT